HRQRSAASESRPVAGVVSQGEARKKLDAQGDWRRRSCGLPQWLRYPAATVSLRASASNETGRQSSRVNSGTSTSLRRLSTILSRSVSVCVLAGTVAGVKNPPGVLTKVTVPGPRVVVPEPLLSLSRSI